jgi:hypothetical protein
MMYPAAPPYHVESVSVHESESHLLLHGTFRSFMQSLIISHCCDWHLQNLVSAEVTPSQQRATPSTVFVGAANDQHGH